MSLTPATCDDAAIAPRTASTRIENFFGPTVHIERIRRTASSL
jgi:hypothetical protein